MPEAPAARRWAITSVGALLLLLAFINFLNYVDRMIIGGLGPFLQDSKHKGGLGLSSSQVGALQGAFMVVHSLASIPLGYLADRYARRILISIGVGVWSLATAAAGLAQSFWQLFVARATVGIGEATYAPAATALISERVDPGARAKALSVFQLGMVIGSTTGYALGGFIGARFGWPMAFFVVGVPGILLALLALFLYEGPRTAKPDTAVRAALRELWSLTRVRWINAAGVLVTFFNGAVFIWGMPFILRAHYGGESKFVPEALIQFGLPALAATLLGTLTGAFVADRLERRRPGGGRMRAVAFGVFAGAPLVTLGLLSASKSLQIALVASGVFFISWYVAPILAALHDAVPVRLRGTATGVYFFVIHALGDAISPLVVGVIDDATGSLRPGMLLATAMALAGGICAFVAGGAGRTPELKAARRGE